MIKENKRKIYLMWGKLGRKVLHIKKLKENRICTKWRFLAN